MKQKLRKIKILFLLTISSFVSCQPEEEVVEQNNYQNSFTIERISENEFKKKAPKAFGKMELLKQNASNNSHQRTVNINNEFIVDTEEIVQITKGNKVSYTLPIYRTINNGLVENLVLSLQNDNSFAAKIITYNLSQSEKDLLQNGMFVDVNNKMQVQNLDNANSISSNIFARTSSTCYEVQTEYEMCCKNVHSTLNILNGERCQCPNPPTGYTYTITAVACEEDNDGGDTTPTNTDPTDYTAPGDGTSSSGGNGDGSTGTETPNDEDNTNNENEPVDNLGDEDLTIPIIRNPKTKPCQDLNDKSNNSDFINIMQELKNNANNPVESGYVMYKDDPNYSDKQTGGIDESGSYLDLEYDTNRVTNITGFTHCHLNNATVKNFAVFSLDDLIMFGKLVEHSTAPLEELTMFVTSNKGTFAVKIKDKTAFINAINSITPNLYKVYNDIFKRKINKNSSPNNQAKGFIDFFKASGLSTSETYELYQSDANFSNWKKITVDQNNNLVPINC